MKINVVKFQSRTSDILKGNPNLEYFHNNMALTLGMRRNIRSVDTKNNMSRSFKKAFV